MEDRLQPSAHNSGNDLNDYSGQQGKIIVLIGIKGKRKSHLIMQCLNVHHNLDNRTMECLLWTIKYPIVQLKFIE